jgi:hypothetical protein
LGKALQKFMIPSLFRWTLCGPLIPHQTFALIVSIRYEQRLPTVRMKQPISLMEPLSGCWIASRNSHEKKLRCDSPVELGSESYRKPIDAARVSGVPHGRLDVGIDHRFNTNQPDN